MLYRTATIPLQLYERLMKPYVKLLLLCFYKTPNHDVYFDFYMVYLDTTESCEHLL